ncbi:hypothetical protein ACP70R_018310 [Stipagrostis hirtigluma subsp. patula]
MRRRAGESRAVAPARAVEQPAAAESLVQIGSAPPLSEESVSV